MYCMSKICKTSLMAYKEGYSENNGVSFSLTRSVKPGAIEDFKVSRETAILLLSIAGIIANALPPIKPVS